MHEPLFWNPLPDAAAWLQERTGRPMDARTLIDLVAKQGRTGDPTPTIIKTVLPKGVRFAAVSSLSKVGLQQDAPPAVMHGLMVMTFGDLPFGLTYFGEVHPIVDSLCVNDLLGLLVHGDVTCSFLRDKSKYGADVWAMPYGTTFTVTVETCGINRAHLTALGEQMAADEARRSKPASPAEAAPEASQAKPHEGPLPLPTGDVAHCFKGLKWDEAGWKTNLGKAPNWLRACMVTPGRQGGNSRLWDPVKIAAAIVSEGEVFPRTVRARFQTNPILQPWLEAWKTYEADNIDTE